MNKFQAAIILYGLIMIGMALQAYFFPEGKASMISLIAGGGVGIIEIFFAALSKTHPRIGYIGAAVVALLPLGRFLTHLHAENGDLKIYPAVVGSVLCIALALFLVGGHLLSKRRTAPDAAPAVEPPA